MLYAATGTVRPAAPFDFSLSLRVIAATPPLRDVVSTAEGVLSTVVCAGGQPTVLTAFNSGHVDEPRLTCRLVSRRPLGEYATLAVLNRFRFFLGLDDDLRFFYQLGREDAHFSQVIARLRGYHQVRFPTAFEAACWAATGGDVAPAAADRVHAALVERLGPRVRLTGRVRTAFPDAVRVLSASSKELARLPLTERRRRTLLAVAAAFARVDPLFLREASTTEIERWLRGIDGVGTAAARFVLVHGLGRLDAVRSNDRRVRDAYARVYGSEPQGLEARVESAERHFGPWRGHWADYLLTDRLLADAAGHTTVRPAETAADPRTADADAPARRRSA